MSGNHPATWSSLLREAFRGRAFAAAFAVLIVAALGLNASVRFMELYFKKEPVPIGMPFKQAMPAELGPWVQVSRDDVLKEDFLEALGTQEYLFCHYVDTRAVNRTADDLKQQFAGLSYEKRMEQLAQLQAAHPEAVLFLGLTYYTGKADTVAHIPERCYTASGYEPRETPQSELWDVGSRKLDVRCVYFEDTNPNGRVPSNVAYFFYVNDVCTSDSLAVRRKLQDLRERYGYYAKVELTCTDKRIQQQDQAKKSMRDFLTYALPHIEQALPDWSKYQGR